jgi:hypothetical protein
MLIPDQIAWWAAGTDLAGMIMGAFVVGYEFVMRRRLTTAAAAEN